MIGPIPSSWSPRLLSVLRIVAAFLFIPHGTQKLFGVPLAAQAASRAPAEFFSLSWVGGVLEVYGGLLLLLGLFSRPVAFILSGQMAVAYFLRHQPQAFLPILNRGELAAIYCFVFLFLASAGSGPWSLDAVISRRKTTPRG